MFTKCIYFHVCFVQVDVFVRVVFLKIGEIKTVEEKFHADVFIQAKWREPLLDDAGKVSKDIVNIGIWCCSLVCIVY